MRPERLRGLEVDGYAGRNHRVSCIVILFAPLGPRAPDRIREYEARLLAADLEWGVGNSFGGVEAANDKGERIHPVIRPSAGLALPDLEMECSERRGPVMSRPLPTNPKARGSNPLGRTTASSIRGNGSESAGGASSTFLLLLPEGGAFAGGLPAVLFAHGSLLSAWGMTSGDHRPAAPGRTTARSVTGARRDQEFDSSRR
jgi:hypothetical protein